jgi:broad specificity phosphatase PhoE
MPAILTGMRRTVYLARHGETAWNRVGRWQGQTDVTLNDHGRAQSRLLATTLRTRGIVQLGSSDLARARETAEIVAAELGLDARGITLDAGLRERSFGGFEGLTRDECAARFPDEWARYRADIRLPPPGGEPHAAVVTRMRAAVQRAALALPDDAGAVVLISHGGAMRALVTAITGVEPLPLDNGAMFRIETVDDGFGAIERIG